MTERVAITGTGWRVWTDALLRSTGFPADGLTVLSAPDCAAAADALLVSGSDEADAAYRKAFRAAELAGAEELSAIAADPLLREAITWQNPTMLGTVDGLRKTDPAVRNRRRRERERAVVRYWHRYCGKNEMIGFFGPICWVRVDPRQAERIRLDTGPGLVRRRDVVLERWVVAGYAARLAADPRVRRWLCPTTVADLSVEGRTGLRPGRPPLALGPVEVMALTLSDGSRSAERIAAALAADPALGLRSPDDGFLVLDRLAERGLLDSGGDVPVEVGTEGLLAERLAAIGDPELRAAESAGFDRLRAARDRVAAAAGQPTTLAVALRDLDGEVEKQTGGSARQGSGQMYAGRTPCYEETQRDLDLTIGGALLADLAAPLELVLRMARWLTVTLADAYRIALDDLVDGPDMRLGDLMYLAQGLFWSGHDRPVDAVGAEFNRRWSALLDLAGLPAGTARVERDAHDLAARVAELFPAERPGWSAAVSHSPDIQLCAPDVAAINRGDYLAVLGELHTARCTLDTAVPWHPDPAALWAAMAADSGGPDVLRPLYPVGWPRHTGRVSMSPGPYGRRLGFVPAPRPTRIPLVPAMAVRLERRAGELVAVEPDGRRWPVVEVFSEWLAVHSVDAFKLLIAGAHQPRITVGRLVLAREAWRLSLGDTGLADRPGDENAFLTARRLRGRLGLPYRVFAKIGTEVKPCFVDLTSPHSVSTFAAMVRAAARSGGHDVSLTISEALPDVGAAWLPDAAGRRYFSELRLQLTDPARPA
ncbi:lantibiotic dehydratase [Plantactinospora sp. GCM10030261]|uniref:lantibiotic dehydratase n=1 Tax=Plantactinospora sp. GCM10030261 TaxID=3273420 RepID=UPI003621C5E6